MTIVKLALTGSLAALTAGCMTPAQTGDAIVDPVPGEGGMCRAESSQELIGQRATAEIGTRIREQTGAEIFQWVPQGSAVTMDYRENRVRVGYDRAMAITTIACG